MTEICTSFSSQGVEYPTGWRDRRAQQHQLSPGQARGFAGAAAKAGAGKQKEKKPSVADLPKHDVDIIRELAPYLWPKENPELRARVVAALSLLVASKASIMALRAARGAGAARQP